MSANRRLSAFMLGQVSAPITDKVWDFLEPDYAYTHMNTGSSVVAGDGIQHWLSREGKKALGGEIYTPSFYNILNTGWTYDSLSDSYDYVGTAAAFIQKTMPATPLVTNKLYSIDSTVTKNVPTATGGGFTAAVYIGGPAIGAGRLLQPYASGGSNARFNAYSDAAGNNFTLKIDSIKPVQSIIAYQSTATARPVARVDSRGAMYSEWDLTDDAVTSYFDSAITGGEIMLATSDGIYFSGLTTPTNQFSFGPTSYTGGAANILSALKDQESNKLHLYGLRVKTTGAYTVEEKAYLIWLYKAVTDKGVI